MRRNDFFKNSVKHVGVLTKFRYLRQEYIICAADPSVFPFLQFAHKDYKKDYSSSPKVQPN